MSKSRDAFRTISEVADWLDTPAHVLRFWESKFAQVKPVKRAGGRRYYRPNDMRLLGGLKKLLHEDGMTIRAVQALLRESGVKHVAGMSPSLDVEDDDFEGTVENPSAKDTTTDAPDRPDVDAGSLPQDTPEGDKPIIRGLPPASLSTPELPFDHVDDDVDESIAPETTPSVDVEPPPDDLPFLHRDEAPEFLQDAPVDAGKDTVDDPELEKVDQSASQAPAEDTTKPYTPQAPPPDGEAATPFLRAASTALDEHTEARAAQPEHVDPVEVPPAGPVRTDALRDALMAAGGMDQTDLDSLYRRLKDLRSRMAGASRPGPSF